MEGFETRYAEVMVNPDKLQEARALRPIHERPVFGRSVLLYQDVDRERLASLGEVRRPSIADVFVAVISGRNSEVENSSAVQGGTNI
jgi:ABC-2 type transport system ATP-binding protein